MTCIRAHLSEGYAELIDDFGHIVAEWHDKKYATAILNGECTVQRWHQMFHDMAVEEGWLTPVGDNLLVATGWLKVIH